MSVWFARPRVQERSVLNARERFLAIMNFEPVDRPLYWEFCYWAPTVRRWYNEGLEKVWRR